MLHIPKRPIFILASGSASFVYLCNDDKFTTNGATEAATLSDSEKLLKPHATRTTALKTIRATSRQDQQPCTRDVASGLFSALVKSTQVFTTTLALCPSIEADKEALKRDHMMKVLSMKRPCAQAIEKSATRYEKETILTLAAVHDQDLRIENGLHRLVTLENPNCHSELANLASFLSLAIADVPDSHLESALWSLVQAVTSEVVIKRSKWRKVLFGDDRAAKTRRKLIESDTLWDILVRVGSNRSEMVQLQAARLIRELSHDVAVVHRLQPFAEILVQWMNSSCQELATTAFDIVTTFPGVDHILQQQLVGAGALNTLRAKIMEDLNQQVTAKVLRTIRSLAAQTNVDTASILDQDALSFVSDSTDGEPLYDDGIENMSIVLRHGYVVGWIDMFTAFLKSKDVVIQNEAALCLEQIATYGAHKDQVIQEWLIAVLDSVLDKVPIQVAKGACSVRDARSRTLPIQGLTTDTLSYQASHAKALRALAFVVERKECQEEFIRRGGVSILRTLLHSKNEVVQHETARVLANLFACDDLTEPLREFAISECQLDAALDTWTQSENIRLAAMAHRARSNRRYQMTRQHGALLNHEVKYLDGIYPLHLSGSSSAQPKDYDVDIVFVHGLMGCPFRTWTCGEEQETVWAQQWLLDDMKQEGRNPRVLSVGYDSQLLASGSMWKPMCLEETGIEILSQLAAARVGCGDRPVVFVTHSLGGILLKQVFLASATSKDDSSKLINNVNGVVFYGVPHRGSPVAQRIQTFKPPKLTQHPVTEHLHGTPHLAKLNDWCLKVFEEKNIPCLSVGESLPCRLPVIGVEALVVPPISANPGFGDFISISNATHVDICKPASTSDLRYKLVRKFISKTTAFS